MSRRAIDLTGQVFGRLTVVERAGSVGHNAAWLCQCACGSVARPYLASNLKSGCSTSCGCAQVEGVAERNQILRQATVHGKAARMPTMSKVYQTWLNMRRRCNDPRSKKFKDYGGRGIRVCQAWNDSFEAFYADMGDPPSERHSIERKDVNGDYTPSNCCWATNKEQANNRRNSRRVTWNGRTQTVAQWADELAIPARRIWQRLKRGWSPEEALSTTSKG